MPELQNNQIPAGAGGGTLTELNFGLKNSAVLDRVGRLTGLVQTANESTMAERSLKTVPVSSGAEAFLEQMKALGAVRYMFSQFMRQRNRIFTTKVAKSRKVKRLLIIVFKPFGSFGALRGAS